MTTPQEMQSQVLGYMKQGQQAALDAVTAMTETWGGAEGPAGSGGDLAELFPAPAKFVDQVFDFWVQLLEAQRALAHRWLDAVAPGALDAGPLIDLSAWTTPATRKTPASSGPAWSAPASSAPPSSAPARSAGLPADEHVSAAASDAVARAAGLTAAKTRS